MTKPIAWSWSRLDCFEACPKQFYHKNILKDIPFEQNEAMRRGERIHKHFENALNGSKIHAEIRNLTPLIEKLNKIQWDEKLIEAENAYDQDLKKQAWFGKRVWVRIKQDFMARKGKKAVAYDLKTGKNRGYTDQLKLYAGDALHRWPEVEEVRTAYIYSDSNQKCEKVWTRDDYEHIWQDFGDRAERIQICNEAGVWEPKPSNSACRFCPVKDCNARV
jgi:hypothetical protein